MSRPRVLVVPMIALLATACIGRPVVGERDPDDAVATGQCEDDGLNCGDWATPDPFPELEDALFRRDGDCSDEVVAMRVGPAADLESTDLIEGLDLSCTTLELTVANGANVTLSGASVQDARLVLISEGSATVTLLSPIGDDVAIEVQGMSTLRLRSMVSEGLRVDAASSGLGWDVEIENSALSDAAIRTGPDASLLLRGSEVRDATLSAGQLSLATLTLESVVADAKELIASGTDLMDGELRVRRGTYASGTIEGTIIQGCESMLITGTAVRRSDVGACEAGPLELRNGTVHASMLRGRIFALQSRIVESVLGGELGSSISLFDSRLSWSLLCTPEALAARGGSVLFCARCQPESPRAACIDESTAVAVVACPELADAPSCDEGLPESLRDTEDVPTDALLGE